MLRKDGRKWQGRCRNNQLGIISLVWARDNGKYIYFLGLLYQIPKNMFSHQLVAKSLKLRGQHLPIKGLRKNLPCFLQLLVVFRSAWYSLAQIIKIPISVFIVTWCLSPPCFQIIPLLGLQAHPDVVSLLPF